ncbi:putative dna-directed rna polymerase i and iii 14 kda polypeptide protein [Phaeoacremonium minimum UCRPA7]|uniref:DNA-directed RNA polymerases I and III subunit RPAC2 n=1 Tax=Phaeoacremonium minimum (strain UCR-PA7) TaxID=1286976 RepID=R8BTX3_PHAM7|nr:putative dna-directed rna polymerase i and iii 14 kda polypeptide protein [Phaeoacremonium minimum UCRPA7]EOO02811.1 putative dna-directed rna polymerase i and iii 14 kda polypeptide protein [Phaeoacremonium minimum UCRPA7]
MAPKSKSRRAEPEAAEDTTMEDAPPSHQPQAEDNAEPQEADQQMDQDVEEEEEEDESRRVNMLPGSTPTAASFEFIDEGHTLGNALRFIIMKNPEVEFCAYAIPHPSEAKMNIRIQTYEGTTAIEALEKGLKDLQDLCDVVADKFWTAAQGMPKTPAPSKKQLDENGVPL